MKKTFSVMLILALILGSFSFAFATGEPDFSRLTEHGILLGDQDGNLMLDKQLTRAGFVTFALRLRAFCNVGVKALDEKADFTDVAADAWFAPHIGLAVQEGLVVGRGDGTFAPDEEVTYIQVLTILLRVLGYSTEGLSWPAGYYEAAVAAGLVDQELTLNHKVTRKQMAKAIETALDLPFFGEELTLAQELGIEPVLEIGWYDISRDGKTVTFTMVDWRPVSVPLETALKPHVETEITFVYEGKNFSETVIWDGN